MDVAVIQYNAGNIRSLSFALERMSVSHVLTADPDVIRSARRVIFPGVGEAGSTMAFLKETGLDDVIRSLKQPVLGICLGMQLLCSYSEENDTPCLGILDVPVKRIPSTPDLKVPHMGWNNLEGVRDWLNPSLEGSHAYFVHSFYVPDTVYTVAVCDYGVKVSASLRKDNFFAVQFHPEKSADTGRTVLESFMKATV